MEIMQKAKSVKIPIMLFMLVLSTAIVLPAKAFPGDKPAIVVEPSNIQNPLLVPGSTFLVNVSLYNATMINVPNGIAGVEIHLSWNNSVIQPLSFVNKITAVDGALAGASVLYGLSPGFFDVNGTRISSPPYTNATTYEVAAGSTLGGWWGNGKIVTINFTVITVGRSDLSFAFTDLTDALANEVDHYVQNGVFDNRVPPPLPPPVTMYVDPASIINSLLTPPSSFQINLSIVNAVNLADFGFGLSFNSSILQATSAAWSWNGSALGLQINNGAGIINGSSSISLPITGSLPLVTMNFNVTGLGESTFHIFGTFLFDNNGFAVPINATHDGYFNNMLITRLYVDPSFREDPNLHLGNTTVFSIVGENFPNVRTCQFDLRFNPNVLRVLSYMVANPIDGSFVNFQLLTFNNTLGDLSGILTYDPPLSIPSSPIINITFMIVGYGTSPLNLNSSALTDPIGNLISHQTSDGLFITVLRDVAILSVQPNPLKVYPNRIVTVNVTATNLGNYVNETFTVTAYVDTNVSIGVQNVINLLPGANTTLTFYWDTTGQLSCTNHTLSANASLVPFEFNATNNFFTSPNLVKIKIFGDINGDGKVDLFDLVLMANAYGSKVGDLKYNPEADFNNDGKVNLLDLVTLATHYGQSC
jgi:hypothetical protein